MGEQEVTPDDLRDIHGFMAIQVPTWVWVVLALAALALIVWLLLKYVFKPKPKVPLSVFEETVNQLRALDLNADSKEFYINYSEIVRLYLEKRLHISLLDKTADEIKPLLIVHPKIQTNNAMSLTQIFLKADLAKFAKQELSTLEKESDINQTIQVLTSVEDIVSLEEQKLAAAEKPEEAKI